MYSEKRKRKNEELAAALEASANRTNVESAKEADYSGTFSGLEKKKEESDGPKLSDFGKNNEEIAAKADASIADEEKKKKMQGFASAISKSMMS